MKALSLIVRISQGALLALVIIAGHTFGPAIEARWWPVYSRFTVDQLYPDPKGVRVRFRFEKLKNCDPLNYTFYASTSLQPLTTTPLDGIGPPRPLGNQLTGLFLIHGVTVEQFQRDVIGVIRNNCNPFFMSRTVIYP